MPLILDECSLANADGTIKVEYKVWERIPGPDPEPMFVPAPVLSIDLGGGPVEYSLSEYTSGTLTSPALTCLTVTIAKETDTGSTLFTVLIPRPVPPEGSSVAQLQAVAFRTVNRTFLANVGKEFPAESFDSSVLSGTYSQSS
jgi:hypothetical protein